MSSSSDKNKSRDNSMTLTLRARRGRVTTRAKTRAFLSPNPHPRKTPDDTTHIYATHAPSRLSLTRHKDTRIRVDTYTQTHPRYTPTQQVRLLRDTRPLTHVRVEETRHNTVTDRETRGQHATPHAPPVPLRLTLSYAVQNYLPKVGITNDHFVTAMNCICFVS